ncbi:MAG TPA: hypothetical protein VFH61_01620 [Thermoleophilia bacterium]|nr:hypothetical protein [Thermoleophilia bacterium]
MNYAVWPVPITPATDFWTQDDWARSDARYRPKGYEGGQYDQVAWDTFVELRSAVHGATNFLSMAESALGHRIRWGDPVPLWLIDALNSARAKKNAAQKAANDFRTLCRERLSGVARDRAPGALTQHEG